VGISVALRAVFFGLLDPDVRRDDGIDGGF
jgi:hypothetical protein